MTFVLLIFAMLFTEFALMTAFEIQRSTMIAFTYALNFVIVVFIIAAWPFLGKGFELRLVKSANIPAGS